MRFVLILLTALFPIALSAQLDSLKKTENFPKRVFSDVSDVGKSIIYTYERPFKWKKKEWGTLGAVLGTAVAISFIDEPVNDFFRRNQSKYLNPFADFGDFVGQPEHQGPFLLGFWGIGVSINNKWMRTTGTMMAASMATSGLLMRLGKTAFGRARPSKGEGSLFFKPFAGKSFHSLPSGHTTLGISSSWILARQFKPLALKIIFYSVPAVVGWSRIYDNAHWFSDVFLSSALGIACAEAVISYYSKNKKEDNDKEASLKLLPTGNGLGLLYRF